jgi:hypothetical protein
MKQLKDKARRAAGLPASTPTHAAQTGAGTQRGSVSFINGESTRTHLPMMGTGTGSGEDTDNENTHLSGRPTSGKKGGGLSTLAEGKKKGKEGRRSLKGAPAASGKSKA